MFRSPAKSKETFKSNDRSNSSDSIDEDGGDDVSTESDDDADFLKEDRATEIVKQSCEAAFTRLSTLKDAWVRITIKNLRVEGIKMKMPTFCYLGGFNIVLKISLGDACVAWVDNARVRFGKEKQLIFEHPLVITIPKYQWEQKVDFLLFEFFRDRSVFLMPSTRWGFVAIEKLEVGIEDEEDEDDDVEEDGFKRGDENTGGGGISERGQTTRSTFDGGGGAYATSKSPKRSVINNTATAATKVPPFSLTAPLSPVAVAASSSSAPSPSTPSALEYAPLFGGSGGGGKNFGWGRLFSSVDDEDSDSDGDEDLDKEKSTLPVHDWLRCKAGLKMGRPLWELVRGLQGELREAQELAAVKASEEAAASVLAAAAGGHTVRGGSGRRLPQQSSSTGLDGRLRLIRRVTVGPTTPSGGGTRAAPVGTPLDRNVRASSSFNITKVVQVVAVAELETAEEAALGVHQAYKEHMLSHAVPTKMLQKALVAQRKDKKKENQQHWQPDNSDLGESDSHRASVAKSGYHRRKPSSFTEHVDPTDKNTWHHVRSLPIHAEATQSAVYQGFKDLCGPLEAVLGFFLHLCSCACGSFRTAQPIPALVHQASAANSSASRGTSMSRATSTGSGDEEMGETPQQAEFKESSGESTEVPAVRKRVPWEELTYQEKRAVIGRRRKLGSLSFDIQYERLDAEMGAVGNGVQFSDWFKSTPLHHSIGVQELSDRDLLFELVATFVNSQTTVMLLFFAIDVQDLSWPDTWLMTAVFVILEFLLLVACNAIQEKRCRFHVFHKALRHGVLIDFENLDDPTTKYAQLPFVLAIVGAVLAALLIALEPHLSNFAKISTTFLVVMNINNGILQPFHTLVEVENTVLSLPKFVESSTECAKKALAMLKHQDEYITLLHLRRVVQKQRFFASHGPSRQKAALFSWEMLAVESYQQSVTCSAENPYTAHRRHAWEDHQKRLQQQQQQQTQQQTQNGEPPDSAESGEDAQKTLRSTQTRTPPSLPSQPTAATASLPKGGDSGKHKEPSPSSSSSANAKVPWTPPEWNIPPLVVDYLPIWYEKRNGKMMLPEGFDRTFHVKFLGMFFVYSILGGIRDWKHLHEKKVLKAELVRMKALRLKGLAAAAGKQPPTPPASQQPPQRQKYQPLATTSSPAVGGVGAGSESTLRQRRKSNDSSSLLSSSASASVSTAKGLSMQYEVMHHFSPRKMKLMSYGLTAKEVGFGSHHHHHHHHHGSSRDRHQHPRHDDEEEDDDDKDDDDDDKDGDDDEDDDDDAFSAQRIHSSTRRTRDWYRDKLTRMNQDFNVVSDKDLVRLKHDPLLTKSALRAMLVSGVQELEADEHEAKAELREDLRFMHYSFWRWTSILLELKFDNPMDDASTFRLKVFRFYSKVAMLIAAALYLNTAFAHSPAFSTTPSMDDVMWDGNTQHPKQFWFLEHKQGDAPTPGPTQEKSGLWPFTHTGGF